MRIIDADELDLQPIDVEVDRQPAAFVRTAPPPASFAQPQLPNYAQWPVQARPLSQNPHALAYHTSPLEVGIPLRRCHVDGLALDHTGSCSRCETKRAEQVLRDQRRLWIIFAAAIGTAILGVVMIFLYLGYEERAGKRAAAEISRQNNHQLVVYTMQGCQACGIAKRHMQDRGIPFVEKDIDRDPGAFAELSRLGDVRVPTFIVGDEVLVGFDIRGVRLNEALKRHNMPTGGAAAAPSYMVTQ